MVDSLAIPTLPPALQERPPTPPRQYRNSEPKSSVVGRFLHQDPGSRRSSAASILTPDSSSESPNISGSGRKKVGWSDTPEYKDPPVVSFDGKGILKHEVQPLPPSAERKPTKSILKAHNGPYDLDGSGLSSIPKLLPPHHHATFATMLESIIQQLAGKDRSSKMDAYLMLSDSLKASDNVPDLKALRVKMSILCSLIEQDLMQTLENGKPDSTLMARVLTLFSTFLARSAIAESLPTEFCVHIVDHAIKLFDQGSMSKEATKLFMFVLAQQNFSSKVMTSDRIGKLVTALCNLDVYIKGKSTAIGRITIYRTLLRQSRSPMLHHTVWVPDLFSQMLSSIKEVRSAAILFGLEASFSVGTETNATKAVLNLFRVEHAEGGRFAEFYSGKLISMSKNKDQSYAVPQIWSVIILFLRSKPKILEQWTYFKLYVEVIQKCFNSGDNVTRVEANYAWNRFVFAIQPNESTSKSMRSLLCQALIGQLRLRKSNTGRKAVISSIYNLLYYAFQPKASSAQLDLYWDEYIIPLFGHSVESGSGTKAVPNLELAKQDTSEACLILQTLFDSKRHRPWSETRAMDNLQHNAVSVTELPAIDSKWLRKNSARAFAVLEPLLMSLYWDLREESPVLQLWNTYIKAISSPAILEIKVHIDALSSLATLFGTLHKVWNLGPEGLQKSQLHPTDASEMTVSTRFLKSFEALVLTAIEGLDGQMMAFTDKLLSISHDTFIPVQTPSHQPSKMRASTRSPLHHMFLLLLQPSPQLEYDQQFAKMTHRLFSPFLHDKRKTNNKSKMDFVKELVQWLPSESTEPCKLIWQVLADFAALVVDQRNPEGTGYVDEPLGGYYREIVSILEIGVCLSPQRPLPGWKTLFETLVNSATLDAGDAGKAIVIIEPIARSFLPRTTGTEKPLNGLSYFNVLLGKTTFPRDRQALDAATKRMWGTKNAGQRNTGFDPYVYLYEYIQLSLETSYGSFDKQRVLEYADTISATASILGRCPSEMVMGVLTKIQSGIACWIIDGDAKLRGATPLSKSITSLWSVICQLIPRLRDGYSHTKILADLEVLICAGLESKHKSIVNATISMWNSTFGSCQSGLEYPERAKVAFLRLRPVADVHLPFFPESLEDEVSLDHRQPSDFVDSQDELGNLLIPKAISFFKPAPESTLEPVSFERVRKSTPQVIIEFGKAGARKRSRESTPEVGRRKSRKREITPTIRHDDSQVQFEAIPSSPMADRVVDSQLLTDNQKEVAERQRAEAAMFPDLKSSPRTSERSARKSTADPDLPLHRSSSRLRDQIPRDTRQTTPTLPIPSDDDHFVASSPTPTRSIRGDIENLDPPSSPPEDSRRDLELNIDGDISSSPPESTPEPGDDPTTDAQTSLNSNIIEVTNHAPSSFVPPLPEPHPEPQSSFYQSVVEDGQTDLVAADHEAGSEINHEIRRTNEENVSVTHQSMGELGNDTTITIDPSAQLDPYTLLQDTPYSDIQYGPSSRESSPADDPSDQLRASQLEHEEMLSRADSEVHVDEVGQKPLDPENEPRGAPLAGLEPIYDPQPPGTPVRLIQNLHEAEQSPNTPGLQEFQDAMSSPASSDKPFEDAVSSPRLNVQKAQAKQISSPLSEIDDSSMLRIMDEYDQELVDGAHNVSFVEDKENQPHETHHSPARKSSANLPSSDFVPAIIPRSAMRDHFSPQTEVRKDKDIIGISNEPNTSSHPSLIPETPAPKQNEQLDIAYYDSDGEEVDMTETIVVDASILELEQRRRTFKRSPRKRVVSQARKRKYQDTREDTADTSEIPDSQDPDALDHASASKRSPAQKKRKGPGRPKRRSAIEETQVPQEYDENYSFLSVDLDASIPDLEISPSPNSFATEEELVGSQNLAQVQEQQFSPQKESFPATENAEGTSDEKIGAVPIAEEVLHTDTLQVLSPSDEQADFPRPEIIEETTLDGEEPSSAPAKSYEDEQRGVAEELAQPLANTDCDSREEIVPAPSQTVESEIFAREEALRPDCITEPDPQPPITVQSMKDKLQSLIDDLKSTALNKLEVYALEDMFMDAKRQLYDAERRGRLSTELNG